MQPRHLQILGKRGTSSPADREPGEQMTPRHRSAQGVAPSTECSAAWPGPTSPRVLASSAIPSRLGPSWVERGRELQAVQQLTSANSAPAIQAEAAPMAHTAAMVEAALGEAVMTRICPVIRHVPVQELPEPATRCSPLRWVCWGSARVVCPRSGHGCEARLEACAGLPPEPADEGAPLQGTAAPPRCRRPTPTRRSKWTLHPRC
mmetsp:Transcript_117724/g.263188  ORF Transcript_117724/g.263188 Transcript_117724/m.263188 type:complete len:205 (+) Transcript_117724:309-923(+)